MTGFVTRLTRRLLLVEQELFIFLNLSRLIDKFISKREPGEIGDHGADGLPGEVGPAGMKGDNGDKGMTGDSSGGNRN
jgi:IS4 transposase